MIEFFFYNRRDSKELVYGKKYLVKNVVKNFFCL